jgi:hypothetical protein
MKKIITITIAIAIIITVITPQVFAQQLSLSLSPPLVELIIKPGKSVLVAYDFINNGDPNYFSASVSSFEPKDNLGNIRLKNVPTGPIRFSLDNSDIQLDQPFFLKTRQRQQLLLRIRTPEGAPNGDYYYSLLVSSQPVGGNEGRSLGAARGTIASNILITVTDSGRIDIKGKIAFFDVIPRFSFPLGKTKINIFDSNDPIPVVLIVANQGQNLIKPRGQISLIGNFGEQIHYEILPQNILSQSQRLIQATPSAQIQTKQPVSTIISGFFVGRYRLSAEVYFGEGPVKLSAATSFIAVPFKFILGLLVASIFGVIIFKKVS